MNYLGPTVVLTSVLAKWKLKGQNCRRLLQRLEQLCQVELL